MADQPSASKDRDRPDEPRAGNGGAPEPQDPGAFIGRKPERATETIPGGVGRKDVRVSAVATQPGPVRGGSEGGGTPPEGHRTGANTTDDSVREAGQDR